MSDILGQIDAAIEDAEGFIEWHGSEDSAEWRADGSHEVETSGEYYGDDFPGSLDEALMRVHAARTLHWFSVDQLVERPDLPDCAEDLDQWDSVDISVDGGASMPVRFGWVQNMRPFTWMVTEATTALMAALRDGHEFHAVTVSIDERILIADRVSVRAIEPVASRYRDATSVVVLQLEAVTRDDGSVIQYEIHDPGVCPCHSRDEQERHD